MEIPRTSWRHVSASIPYPQLAEHKSHPTDCVPRTPDLDVCSASHAELIDVAKTPGVRPGR